jgi:hypothetical protein
MSYLNCSLRPRKLADVLGGWMIVVVKGSEGWVGNEWMEGL